MSDTHQPGSVVVTSIGAHATTIDSTGHELSLIVSTNDTTARRLGDMLDVDTAGKSGNSVLYFDANDGLWKGDEINTIESLVDGGGF